MVSENNTGTETSILRTFIGKELLHIKERYIIQNELEKIEKNIKQLILNILNKNEIQNDIVKDTNKILKIYSGINDPEALQKAGILLQIIEGRSSILKKIKKITNTIEEESGHVKSEIIDHLGKIQKSGNKEDFELIKKYLGIPDELNIYEFLRNNVPLNQKPHVIFSYIENISPGEAQKGIFHMLFPKFQGIDFIEIFSHTKNTEFFLEFISGIIQVNDFLFQNYEEVKSKSSNEKILIINKQGNFNSKYLLFTLLVGEMNKENILEIFHSDISEENKDEISLFIKAYHHIPRDVPLYNIMMGKLKYTRNDHEKNIQKIHGEQYQDFYISLIRGRKQAKSNQGEKNKRLDDKEEALTDKNTEEANENTKVSKDIQHMLLLDSFQQKSEFFNENYSEKLGFEYSQCLDIFIQNGVITSFKNIMFKGNLKNRAIIFFGISHPVKLDAIRLITNNLFDISISDFLRSKVYSIFKLGKPDNILYLLSTIINTAKCKIHFNVINNKNIIAMSQVPFPILKDLCESYTINTKIGKYTSLIEQIEEGKKLYDGLVPKSEENNKILQFYTLKIPNIFTLTINERKKYNNIKASHSEEVQNIITDVYNSVESQLSSLLESYISMYHKGDKNDVELLKDFKNDSQKIIGTHNLVDPNLKERILGDFNSLLSSLLVTLNLPIERYETFKKIDFKKSSSNHKHILLPLELYDLNQASTISFITQGNIETMKFLAGESHKDEEEIKKYNDEFDRIFKEVTTKTIKLGDIEVQEANRKEIKKQIKRLEIEREKNGGYANIPFHIYMKIISFLYASEKRINKTERESDSELILYLQNFCNTELKYIDSLHFYDLNISELENTEILHMLIHDNIEKFVTFTNVALLSEYRRISGSSKDSEVKEKEKQGISQLNTLFDNLLFMVKTKKEHNIEITTDYTTKTVSLEDLSWNCVWSTQPADFKDNAKRVFDAKLKKGIKKN